MPLDTCFAERSKQAGAILVFIYYIYLDMATVMLTELVTGMLIELVHYSSRVEIILFFAPS